MKSEIQINMLKRQWIPVPVESETTIKTPLLKRQLTLQNVKSNIQRQSSLPNNKSYKEFEVELLTVLSNEFDELIPTQVWEKN